MHRTLALIALVSLVSCTTAQVRTAEKTAAAVLIDDQQEFALGLQVHEELKKQNTKFLDDQKTCFYVETQAKKLTAAASVERKLDWMVYVIDDPKTVNAFATPGGRIYVYTGLLLAAQNEAQVAGVLGHEIGHVVGRHSARQLIAAKGLETVVKMALGEKPGEVASLAASLAGKGALLAYGRGEESEADEYGARYANAIGDDPNALAGFFRILQAKYGDQPQLLVWLSTHPSNQERIDHLAAYIAQAGLTAKGTGGPELAAVQRQLGAR